MRHADHGRFGYGGMPDRRILEFDGTDPLATGLDDILGSVGYCHVALGVDRRYIAGVEPAVIRVRTGAAIELEVVAAYPGTAALQRAVRNAIPWQLIAFVVNDAQLEAKNPTARLDARSSCSSADKCSRPLFMVLVTPSGLVSVIPQPCRTSTSWASRNSSIIERGTAAPPTIVRCSESSFLPACRQYCSSAIQIVGTPSDIVTPSDSNSSYKASPSPILGPGKRSCSRPSPLHTACPRN